MTGLLRSAQSGAHGLSELGIEIRMVGLANLTQVHFLNAAC